MPVPPARRKKVMSMFPDQLDRAMQQDQPVSDKCVHNRRCRYMYIAHVCVKNIYSCMCLQPL